MTDWEAIRKEFESSDIKMTDLAEKHNVKASTLRSRKNREKWASNATPENVATRRNENKSVATQQKKAKKKKEPEIVVENSDLTEKQQMFCLMYFECRFNATKAYQKVYDCEYSTAMTEGSRLLRNPKIKDELHRIKAMLQQSAFVTIQDIVNEYIKQSFVDITDFLEFGTKREKVLEEIGFDPESGEPMVVEKDRAYSFVNFKHSDDVDGSLIQEVKQGREGVSIKLYDKQKAMQELMKYIGTDNAGSDKVVIINNSNDERMKKWVEENGGL